MRPDHERDRSNRNNWLLIRHRDGFEREGRHPVTEQDRSVSSGRNREEIAVRGFASKGGLPPLKAALASGSQVRQNDER